MQSTMQDWPLTIPGILRHGAKVHAGSEIVTWLGTEAQRATFAESRARRTARARSAFWHLENYRVCTFAEPQEHSNRISPCRRLARFSHA